MRRVAVLTVSDRCSRGEASDVSGPSLERIVATLGWTVVERACVPDEQERIRTCLVDWSAAGNVDLILTTGGTGLAPRDVTPEAALAVFDREAPGLMELARRRCYDKTPRAYLSRGVAGTIGRTLVLTLPGSVRGATENLEAILDILPHAVETLLDEVQDDGRRDAESTSGRVIHHDD